MLNILIYGGKVLRVSYWMKENRDFFKKQNVWKSNLFVNNILFYTSISQKFMEFLSSLHLYFQIYLNYNR